MEKGYNLELKLPFLTESVCYVGQKKESYIGAVIRLVPGMTLAIEPMITMGRPEVCWLDDDWTVVTEDESLAAHYENTILITEGEPEILTFTK